MKRFLCILFLAASAFGQEQANVLVDTNSLVVFPTNLILSAGTTATTQTAGDNDTSVSTTAFVTAAIEALKALQLWQDTNAVLTTLAALSGGNSTNFFAGDGSFKQVTTNMVPQLVAILNAIAADAASRQIGSSVLTNIAALTSGTTSNFLRGDGAFAQVSSNDIPGLPALISAQLQDAPLDTTTYARSNGTWTANLPAGQVVGTLDTNTLPGLLSGLSAGNGGGVTNVTGGEVVVPPLGITPPFTVHRIGGAYSTSLRMSDYANASRATTRYLLTNGNDSSSGLTWADAKLTLGGALAGLTSGVAVYCGPGVYVANGVTNRVYFTNEISLVCTGGVAQFGQFESVGNYSAYFKGIRFQGGVNDTFKWSNTNASNTLAIDSCSFDGNQNDGFSVYADAGLAYLRDCGSYSNKLDGFNYYAVGGGTNSALWVLEERCAGHWNGWTTNAANNGSTIHGGVSIVRIGSTAYKNEGRNFHDVGRGVSWNINCAGGGSRLEGVGIDVAFACASAADTTTMILEGCEALFGSPLSNLFGTNGTLVVMPFQKVDDAAVVTTTDIETMGVLRSDSGVTSQGTIFTQGTTDQSGAGTSSLRSSGGAAITKSLYVGTYTIEQSMVLRGTNQLVAPTGLSVMGAQLWTDGTNLCVVLQNSGGVRTTNKLSMVAWP